MTVTRAEIVAQARTHLGAPWVHQGRLPGASLDCAGLIIVVARELQLVPADFDVPPYSRSPDGSLLAWCDAHMEPLAEIELGCVLAMVTANEPQHLGIVGDYVHGNEWSLIHACNAAHPPRVIETRLMFASNLRLAGIFRMPGVA